MSRISIIIPAHNESKFIGNCLKSIQNSKTGIEEIEVLVISNGSTDDTESVANSFVNSYANRNWDLQVYRVEESSKIAALNYADSIAKNPIRIYVDADIQVSERLIEEMCEILDGDGALYASGKMQVAPSKSCVSKMYRKVWLRLPFMQDTAPGAGLYAVNQDGRARWNDFPNIISDDTFVRLQFSPLERRQTSSSYQWPMPEGMRNIIRARRRQDSGVAELKRMHPEIFKNENKSAAPYVKIFFSNPTSFILYCLIVFFARTYRTDSWLRGR